MARAQRPRIYTKRIPPVQVTPDMLAELRERKHAAGAGGSIADVVRQAVALTGQVTADMVTALERGAAMHGVPVADLVAEAIVEYERSDWGAL